jgi:LPXTG-site transpeptidase (sortase) family protein
MTRREEIRFIALHSLGNFLVLFSLYGVVATFGPFISEQAKFLILQARGVEFRVAQAVTPNAEQPETPKEQPQNQTPSTPNRGFAEILAGDTEQVLTPKDPSFSLIIPKIGASSIVVSNVDADNKEEYTKVLKYGVAHAKGSVFPGFPGNTYLFAHSADNWWDVGHYNAIFYTLNNLSDNDEIVVFFENRRYNYVVKQKLIADPEDVTYLTGKQEGKHQLVLQTCWPPGTTWKRLYVIAEPL